MAVHYSKQAGNGPCYCEECSRFRELAPTKINNEYLDIHDTIINLSERVKELEERLESRVYMR